MLIRWLAIRWPVLVCLVANHVKKAKNDNTIINVITQTGSSNEPPDRMSGSVQMRLNRCSDAQVFKALKFTFATNHVLHIV